jgi:hypothetical protein
VARLDERWEAYDTFIDIYYENMRRLDASSYYYFPREYFYQLKSVLGAGLQLCLVEIDGGIVAGDLFAETCGIAQGLLSGTRDAYSRGSVPKTLIHAFRHFAKARGNRILHLGGGVGGAKDSLFQFKAGFSHLRTPFFTWRLVGDQRVYAQLVHRWEARQHVGADAIEGYFPAYRKPAADQCLR